MGVAIGLLYNALTHLLPPVTKLAQLTTLLLTIISGILIYLLLSRSRPEQQTLLRALKRSSS